MLDLLPVPRIRAVTNAGVPIPLAKWNFYAAGSSTVRQDTYQDSAGMTLNANPVVSDTSGLFPPIYLLPLAYNTILTDSADSQVSGGFTQDNVAGPNYSALFDSNWVLKDNTDPSKKLQLQLANISTATTRVWTAPDANGIVLLSTYATLGAARLQKSKGANVAAANHLTLGTDGNAFIITGNTEIDLIDATGWQEGSEITLYFTGTPTVKHAQALSGSFKSIDLNGSMDRVMADTFLFKLCYISGAWIEIPRLS